MITEDYVSLETAKLLKEKGFDIPIDTYYDILDGKMVKSGWIIDNFGIKKTEETKERFIYCPTIQMAMKWIREIQHLYKD